MAMNPAILPPMKSLYVGVRTNQTTEEDLRMSRKREPITVPNGFDAGFVTTWINLGLVADKRLTARGQRIIRGDREERRAAYEQGIREALPELFTEYGHSLERLTPDALEAWYGRRGLSKATARKGRFFTLHAISTLAGIRHFEEADVQSAPPRRARAATPATKTRRRRRTKAEMQTATQEASHQQPRTRRNQPATSAANGSVVSGTKAIAALVRKIQALPEYRVLGATDRRLAFDLVEELT